MLYSSDDTHIKNRNATRATPRHDNRIEQESTQESTQETSDRYLVRVISMVFFSIVAGFFHFDSMMIILSIPTCV